MRHYAADIWTESGDRFECLRDVVVQRVRAGECQLTAEHLEWGKLDACVRWADAEEQASRAIGHVVCQIARDRRNAGSIHDQIKPVVQGRQFRGSGSHDFKTKTCRQFQSSIINIGEHNVRHIVGAQRHGQQ